MTRFNYSIHTPIDTLPQYGENARETAIVNAKRELLNKNRVVVVRFDVSELTNFGGGSGRIESTKPKSELIRFIPQLGKTLKDLTNHSWANYLNELYEQSEAWKKYMRVGTEEFLFCRSLSKESFGEIDPNYIIIFDKEGIPQVVDSHFITEAIRTTRR